MGRVYSHGFSGGMASNEATATTDKVLYGNTYIGSDTDDDIGIGSMPNVGSVSKSISPGETYSIQKGYHNGNGKVVSTSPKIARISSYAFYGNFGSDAQNFDDVNFSETFTVPSNAKKCIVYYDGVGGSRQETGSFSYKITLNDNTIASRSSSVGSTANNPLFKSNFTASAGDVIKTSASASSGSATFAFINAVIMYWT